MSQFIEAERRIYASEAYAIIGSNNGLSPDRRQAIIWNNARILLIGPLGTNFNEISIAIHMFSLKKNALENNVSKKIADFVLALMC